MLYIYMVTLCNMDPINIPPMLAYIPAPWILWDMAGFLYVLIGKPLIFREDFPASHRKKKTAGHGFHDGPLSLMIDRKLKHGDVHSYII